MPSPVDMSPSRQLATTALLLACATALGYIEAVLFPAMPVPGFKLGLANVAVVLALSTVGPLRAGVVSIGRVFLVALATGTLAGPTMVLALAGAVASWGVMALMARQRDTFSVIGWSLGGSAAHAVAQLFAAVLVTGTAAPLMLLPISLAASVVAGLVVGLISFALVSRLPLMRPVYAEG